jgi:hypothetical protein
MIVTKTMTSSFIVCWQFPFKLSTLECCIHASLYSTFNIWVVLLFGFCMQSPLNLKSIQHRESFECQVPNASNLFAERFYALRNILLCGGETKFVKHSRLNNYGNPEQRALIPGVSSYFRAPLATATNAYL